MDLELLKRFYLTAQEGTIGKAAERLHVAQSALTRSIQLFEHQMKTKLFERHPKGVQLTPQGERLYHFAKRILEETEDFERIFHEKQDQIEGEIKIITTPFVGSEWLVPHLEDFLEKHPKLRIKVSLRSENIDISEADVAILTHMPLQPHLIQEHLFTVQVRLFASPKYLRIHGVPQSLEDLDNHQLITYRGNYFTPYGSTDWVIKAGKNNSGVIRESYFEIDSLHGMLSSALSGLGIAELPNYSKVTDSELEEVLPHIEGPHTPIYYIYPSYRQKSKKIQLLLKYLREKGK